MCFFEKLRKPKEDSTHLLPCVTSILVVCVAHSHVANFLGSVTASNSFRIISLCGIGFPVDVTMSLFSTEQQAHGPLKMRKCYEYKLWPFPLGKLAIFWVLLPVQNNVLATVLLLKSQSGSQQYSQYCSIWVLLWRTINKQYEIVFFQLCVW